MTFKSWGAACLLGLSLTAWAQPHVNTDPLDWKEGEVPAPPAFDTRKLLTFEVAGSSLVFGVDPATLRISDDGIVRYVMVASSASGARNVFYEGLRCVSGELKTYARYTPEGAWVKVNEPQWRSLFGNPATRHALQLARAGACNNSAPPTSVEEMVRLLKTQGLRP